MYPCSTRLTAFSKALSTTITQLSGSESIQIESVPLAMLLVMQQFFSPAIDWPPFLLVLLTGVGIKIDTNDSTTWLEQQIEASCGENFVSNLFHFCCSFCGTGSSFHQKELWRSLLDAVRKLRDLSVREVYEKLLTAVQPWLPRLKSLKIQVSRSCEVKPWHYLAYRFYFI